MRDVKKSHSPNIDLEKLIEGHGPVPSDQLIAIGDNVGGCEVVALLAKGGNGEVYLGIDHSLGRRLAIKVLARGDEISKARFAIEVKLLSGNEHSWLPKCYGSGVHEGHEYVKIEELVPVELPAKDSAVAKYVVKVAGLVGGLHKMGYIHRDIKPDNVMKRLDGELVLIDLGLVTPIGGASPMQPRLSVAGDVQQCVGTPGFSGPEQFSGGEATVKSDIHALGALVNACFSGNPLPKWRPIIDRAMCSDPKLRFSSIEEFIRAVKNRRRLTDVFADASREPGFKFGKVKRMRALTWMKVAAVTVTLLAGTVKIVSFIRDKIGPGDDVEAKKGQVYDLIKDSCVFIKTPSGRGSGILVNDGGKLWMYTNFHVVFNQDGDGPYESVEACLRGGEVLAMGEIEWVEERNPETGDFHDLVRYPVYGDYIGIPLANGLVDFNDRIFVLGDSGGTRTLSVASGRVLSVGPATFEHDADTAPGNSGGPVVDEHGRLIGLDTFSHVGLQPEVLLDKSRYGRTRNFATLVIGVSWISRTEIEHRNRDRFAKVREKADAGDPDAQCECGCMLLEGIGVDRNPIEGVRYVTQAANAGNAEAKYRLGRRCLTGDAEAGVAKDEKRGIELIEQAADGGCKEAEVDVSKRRWHGKGLPRDFQIAAHMSRKLVNDGVVGARYELGLSFYHGLGTNTNLRLSAELFKQDAEAGSIKAMHMYGKMILDGDVVGVDRALGTNYLERAASSGYPKAMVSLALFLKEAGCTNRADELISKAADQNEPSALYLMYERFRDKGLEESKYKTEARRYLESAAKLGNADAQRVLGDAYACEQFRDNGEYIAETMNLAVATNWWYVAATQGDKRAQYRLGLMLWTGYEEIEINRNEARKWLSLSATNQNDMAQYMLGKLLLEDDPSEASHWLEAQAKKGNPKAMAWLSQMYEQGLGVRKDAMLAMDYKEKAERLLKQLSDKGDSDAMYELAGLEDDNVKRYEKMLVAAKAGSAEAMFYVGWALSNEKDIGISPINSARWYKSSIDHGCILGYSNLGFLYDHGNEYDDGMSCDLQKGFSYYMEGAERGDACSQAGVAWHYIIGSGTKTNYNEAVRWFKRAEQQNYPTAYWGLAFCYGNGFGVEKNSEKFAEYCRRAFECGVYDSQEVKIVVNDLDKKVKNNDPMAYYMLGSCYAVGLNIDDRTNPIPKDKALAIDCFKAAAELGMEEAKERLLKEYGIKVESSKMDD